MSLNQDGAIIILSSPSGAGKTTLVKKLSNLKKFNISVSYTTRTPRSNEVNGKDYYFVSKDDFQKLIYQNQLLEHAIVFNNYYGSSKKKVFKLLDEGINVIFDIDWQGAQQIKNINKKYHLISFFILPPSKKTLINRLSEREKNDKIIDERMKNFSSDVKHWKDYDYVVVNDDLEICLQKIINYIDGSFNSKKFQYDKNEIDKHVSKLLK